MNRDEEKLRVGAVVAAERCMSTFQGSVATVRRDGWRLVTADTCGYDYRGRDFFPDLRDPATARLVLEFLIAQGANKEVILDVVWNLPA